MEYVPTIIQLVFAGGLLGLMWRMYSKCQEASADAYEDLRKETTNQISNVYRRFDEYKDHSEEKFVLQAVHNVQYDNLDKKVDEIKTDVKKLLAKSETRDG